MIFIHEKIAENTNEIKNKYGIFILSIQILINQTQ